MTIAKKGQLSWFVVLGLVLVIFMVLVIWLSWAFSNSVKPFHETPVEDELREIKDYMLNCEKHITEEAFILLGNQGGRLHPIDHISIENRMVSVAYDQEIKFPTLQEIKIDLNSYITKQVRARCDPNNITPKMVEAESIRTMIDFRNKDSLVRVSWPITLNIGNETKKSMDYVEFSVPVRLKLIHSAVLEDLISPDSTDLTGVEVFDSLDFHKVLYNKDVLGIVIDHKFNLRGKPYKFFYAISGT